MNVGNQTADEIEQ